MPTREQIERSRERNRKRGVDRQYIVDAVSGARKRTQKLAAAPAEVSSTWRGPEPPAAA